MTRLGTLAFAAAIHPNVLRATVYAPYDIAMPDTTAARGWTFACVLATASCRDPNVDEECTPDDAETNAELRDADAPCGTCEYGTGNQVHVWIELRTSCESGITWEAFACGELARQVSWRRLDGTLVGPIEIPNCLAERSEEMTLEPGAPIEQRVAPLGLLFHDAPPAGIYVFDVMLDYGFAPARFEATLVAGR